jgi:hypothetical protein
MARDPDPTTPGARFPYAAAAFACACVAAAVWTFMLYSYAWDVRTDDFAGGDRWGPHPLAGRYVRLHRPAEGRWSRYWSAGDGLAEYLDHLASGFSTGGGPVWVPIKGLPEGASPEVIHGRVVAETSMGSTAMRFLGAHATASRWTGASVAGLVVGAMGVFVFALHLR